MSTEQITEQIDRYHAAISSSKGGLRDALAPRIARLERVLIARAARA